MRVYLGMLGHYDEYLRTANGEARRHPAIPGVVLLARSVWEIIEDFGKGEWRFDNAWNHGPYYQPMDPLVLITGPQFELDLVSYNGNGNEYILIRAMEVEWIQAPEPDPEFEPRPATRPLRAIMAP